MHFYFAQPHDALAGWLGPTADWTVTHLRFGYETFFVLAGYFLARSFQPGDWSYLSLRSFFTRRLTRLAVPYWVAVLVGVAGWHLRAAFTGHQPPERWADFWPLLFFVHDLVPTTSPNLALWFMAPLFQFYLLWGLLFWVVRLGFLNLDQPGYHNKSLGILAGITGLVLVASLAVGWSGTSCQWSLANNAVYLSMGCFVYWTSIHFLPGWWLALILVAVARVGLSIESSRPEASVVASLTLLGLCWWGRTPAPLRPLSVVGRWSYSIYLTQMYVGPRVLHLAGARPLSVSEAAGLLFAAVVVSVLVGGLFYVLVEAPLARFSHRLAYRG